MDNIHKLLLLDGNSSPAKIGGIAIGTAGTGIYSGYKLQGGDDFIGNTPNLWTPITPHGVYGTTGVYSAGSRSKAASLSQAMDTDPYFTGESNSNNGAPFISDTITQSNSVVTLKARIAQGSELPYLNTRTYVSAMLHTNGKWVLCAPFIFETYTKFNILLANLPGGNHNTEWVMNTNPITQTTGNKIEVDWTELNSGNLNIHGTVSGPGSLTFATGEVYDDNWHTITQAWTAGGITAYQDGVSKGNTVQDGTITGISSAIYLTNHITSPTQADWAAIGIGGLTASHDWWRAWAANYVKKLSDLPDVYVNFGGSVSYTFPAVTALYAQATALGITDYIQAMRMENFEPGASTPGTNEYFQIPSWASLTGRTLTGTPDYPGTLNMISQPYLAGSMGEVCRGHIYVGPTIVTSAINATLGTAGSYNLYQDCECGTLFPNKKITVTGLPTGFTFDGLYTISWSGSTVLGTTSINIGVTNAVGQTATKAVNTVVSSAIALSIDGTNNLTNTSSATTIIPLTTTNANDVIYAYIKSTYIPGFSITGITDTAGLIWTRRSVCTNSSNTYAELWAAFSPNALAPGYQITVNQTGINPSRYCAWGVTGANVASNFDTNVSIPAIDTTVITSTATCTVSTNHANDMLIACIEWSSGTSSITLPSGFTRLMTTATNMDISYKVETSTLSNATVTYGWGNTLGVAMIVDAVQGQ